MLTIKKNQIFKTKPLGGHTISKRNFWDNATTLFKKGAQKVTSFFTNVENAETVALKEVKKFYLENKDAIDTLKKDFTLPQVEDPEGKAMKEVLEAASELNLVQKKAQIQELCAEAVQKKENIEAVLNWLLWLIYHPLITFATLISIYWLIKIITWYIKEKLKTNFILKLTPVGVSSVSEQALTNSATPIMTNIVTPIMNTLTNIATPIINTFQEYPIIYVMIGGSFAAILCGNYLIRNIFSGSPQTVTNNLDPIINAPQPISLVEEGIYPVPPEISINKRAVLQENSLVEEVVEEPLGTIHLPDEVIAAVINYTWERPSQRIFDDAPINFMDSSVVHELFPQLLGALREAALIAALQENTGEGFSYIAGLSRIRDLKSWIDSKELDLPTMLTELVKTKMLTPEEIYNICNKVIENSLQDLSNEYLELINRFPDAYNHPIFAERLHILKVDIENISKLGIELKDVVYNNKSITLNNVIDQAASASVEAMPSNRSLILYNHLEFVIDNVALQLSFIKKSISSGIQHIVQEGFIQNTLEVQLQEDIPKGMAAVSNASTVVKESIITAAEKVVEKSNIVSGSMKEKLVVLRDFFLQIFDVGVWLFQHPFISFIIGFTAIVGIFLFITNIPVIITHIYIFSMTYLIHGINNLIGFLGYTLVELIGFIGHIVSIWFNLFKYRPTIPLPLPQAPLEISTNIDVPIDSFSGLLSDTIVKYLFISLIFFLVIYLIYRLINSIIKHKNENK